MEPVKVKNDEVDLRVTIGSLELQNPVMTASGTFGYAREFDDFVDLRRLGAVVVKGISLAPRAGNPPPRIVETACGMLNAIGLENVGVDRFISEKMPYLSALGIPIFVNILGDSVEEYSRIAERLANVVSLMDGDAPRAKAMLESFTDYLRASLGSLRRDAQTLGDELALVEAYLHIIGIRMEGRLQYRIDVPDALRALTLPSLSLQPLVENAVQHGLEPQIVGGSVVIAARVEADSLVVTVTDDGLGLNAPGASTRRGTGTALANIRERLKQRFGERGQLTLEPLTPHGVRATLRLPGH